MLYSVKFYRFDIVGIFIFRVRRFAGKRRYILLIWRNHSDMVHYLKKSWVIILTIYCLTFISIPVTFIQHKVASMIWITNA
jgi:hypothetical protein